MEAEEATLPEETGLLVTPTPGHEDQVVPEEATVEKVWNWRRLEEGVDMHGVNETVQPHYNDHFRPRGCTV